MKEVYPGIYLITEKFKNMFTEFSVNIYLLAGSDGLIFDGGFGTKNALDFAVGKIREVRDQYHRSGKKFAVTRILPSHGHWDHFSGLVGLRRELGMKILLTEGMTRVIGSKRDYKKSFREAIGVKNADRNVFVKLSSDMFFSAFEELYYSSLRITPVPDADEIIPENGSISINRQRWEIIHAPGHCDDHIHLYHRKNGVLLAGDNILRSITTWLGPPRSNLEQYMQTLAGMLALPHLKLILPAHGSPITNPQKRLSEAIRHREKRTRQVAALLRRAGTRGMTADAIVKTIYPGQSIFRRFLTQGWIMLTLQYLLDKDQIAMCGEKRKRYINAVGK